jgi:hypothetical protein
MNITGLKNIYAELQTNGLTLRQFELLTIGESSETGRGFLDRAEMRQAWEANRALVLASLDTIDSTVLPYAAYEFDCNFEEEATGSDLAEAMQQARRPLFTSQQIAELENSCAILVGNQKPLDDSYPERIQRLAAKLPASVALQFVREWKAASYFHKWRGRHHEYVKFRALAECMAAELKAIQENGYQPPTTT